MSNGGVLAPGTLSFITTVTTQMNVDNVGSVVVTDITQDPNTMLYVRQVRVFDPSSTPLLVFTLQISSPTQSAIEFTAPSVMY